MKRLSYIPSISRGIPADDPLTFDVMIRLQEAQQGIEIIAEITMGRQYRGLFKSAWQDKARY